MHMPACQSTWSVQVIFMADVRLYHVELLKWKQVCVFIFTIWLFPQHFSESKMSRLHDHYSHGGWLVSHKFLGPLVEDPLAAFPVGQCTPKTHIYMVGVCIIFF